MRVGEIVTAETQKALIKALGRPVRVGDVLSVADVARARKPVKKRKAKPKASE